MSVARGLAAIKKMQQERAARKEEMDRVKITWFKLKKNETRNVAFLQELDEESENFDPAKGTVIFVVEHSPEGPEGWKYRAMCTAEEEGRCWACEMAKEDPKTGLKAKTNMYANVVDEDGEIKVFSRSVFAGIVDTLTDYYDEEENITGTGWRVSKGSDQRAGWTGLPSRKRPEIKGDAELFDLEKVVVNRVTYTEQRAYYEPGLSLEKSDDDGGSETGGNATKDDSDAVEW